jgi:succinate dehydrogenase iron-sulfur subunit
MENILIKIKRQDDPDDIPYWELFEVPYVASMSVGDALGVIRESPVTIDERMTTPVVWDCACREAMCGSCAMLIDGKASLACRTLVEDCNRPIVLEPLSKFPIVRDLRVDRGCMFDELGRASCWTGIDGMEDVAGREEIVEEQGFVERMLGCIMCGLCSEACPQVNDRSKFAGSFVFAQVLALNRHPVGRIDSGARLTHLAARGGVSDCGAAHNCEAACPRGIPLVEAGSRISWDVMTHSLKSFFWG